MASIVNMPIGGYPLAMYGMAALTTAVLAYATISSGSSDNAGASVSSSVEKSGEGMLGSIFGSSSSGESKPSEGGIMGSLGSIMSPGESKPESPPVSDEVKGGGKKKRRRTKNKREKRKSEKSNRK